MSKGDISKIEAGRMSPTGAEFERVRLILDAEEARQREAAQEKTPTPSI